MVFLLGDTKSDSVQKWIRRTGSTSAGATPCKPNTQACHFDRRSRSIHLDPFHYVSLVHNGPQHFQFSGIKVVKDYQKPWLKQEKFQILIKSSKRQP